MVWLNSDDLANLDLNRYTWKLELNRLLLIILQQILIWVDFSYLSRLVKFINWAIHNCSFHKTVIIIT